MSYGLSNVLDEKTTEIHKEYLRRQKLRYSVLEKSCPLIVGKGIFEIPRLKGIPSDIKREALLLGSDIMLHEIYFDSFGIEYPCSELIKKDFRQESSFLYMLFERAKETKDGFLTVYIKGTKAEIDHVPTGEALRLRPILAIDLCEHAYLFDYGFERDEYLKRVLPRLKLNVLDKFLQS